MNYFTSQKFWIVSFILITIILVTGSIHKPKWVKDELINYRHRFVIMTGFYFKNIDSNGDKTKIVEISYLLLPELQPVTILKTTLNKNTTVKSYNSPFDSYIGILLYLLMFIVFLKHTMTCKINKNKQRQKLLENDSVNKL
jgi:succinate dehydrogenase/fumarate reductase cytochrome b subunit